MSVRRYPIRPGQGGSGPLDDLDTTGAAVGQVVAVSEVTAGVAAGFELIDGGDSLGLGGVASSIAQTESAIITTIGTTITATLDDAPAPGRLVLAALTVDKNAGAINPPAEVTVHGSYVGASIGQAVGSAEGLAALTWTWTTARWARLTLLETSLVDAVFAAAATYPNPVNDTSVTSISGDLGAAEAAGTVYAFVSVDTTYDAPSTEPWAAETGRPTWTNGFEQVGKFQTAASAGIGGQALVVAKRDVAAGDSTALTVDWAGGSADQAVLTMVRFAHTNGDTASRVAALGNTLHRVVHDGTTYGPRPAALPGFVDYVGPTQPTDWLPGDTWIETT